MDVEVFTALEFLFQKFDALLVDFDGSELHGTVQQVLCTLSPSFAGRSPAISFAVGTSRKFWPNLRRRALSIGGKDRKMTVGVRI